MTYLHHVLRCNSYDPTGYRPMRLHGRLVGYVTDAVADALGSGTGFVVSPDLVEVIPAGPEPEQATRILAEGHDRLRDASLAGPVRGEPYAVVERVGDQPLAAVDRGVATRFGVVNTGFHLNGVVTRGDGPRMWIARRALTKGTFPGMLDNMVAGGQPMGLSVADNVVKECAEEAGIPAGLARAARPAGAITYAMDAEEGLRRHVMYVYDLEVPADFVPEPVDGEVGGFELLPIEEVARIVRTELDAFKYNCSLVVIDFLVRHGFIAPDEPDYPRIVTGLRSPLP